MAIPRKLLQAAFATLSEATLRKAAEHNEVRGRQAMSAAELAEKLGRDDGTNLRSFSSHLTLPELKKIASVFEINAKKASKDDLEYAVWSFVGDYDEIQESKQRQNQSASRLDLSAQELLAAADAMRRPVAHLRKSSQGRRAAIWHAAKASNGEDERLWISVDLRWHPDPSCRRDGVLYVFIDEGASTGRVEFSAGSLPAARKGEIELSAQAELERPPLELLLERAPSAIQKRLDEFAKHGWDLRKSTDDLRFPLQEVLEGYRRLWASKHPLYGKTVAAQLGGWPLTWPDESSLEQIRRTLVLRTYRNAEPWIEVFRARRRYEVRLRIT